MIVVSCLFCVPCTHVWFDTLGLVSLLFCHQQSCSHSPSHTLSCIATTQRDPFTLYFDGEDKLYGRGTTDCLGHVAMLTFVFKALAERKPILTRSVVALFISGEEGGETGVGIDLVVKVKWLIV